MHLSRGPTRLAVAAFLAVVAFGFVLITGIGSGSASAASLSDYGFVVAGGTDEPFQAQLSMSDTVKAIPIAATGTSVGTLGITPGSPTVLVDSVSTSEPGGLPVNSLRADDSIVATFSATTSPNANAMVQGPYGLLVTVSGGKSILGSNINPDLAHVRNEVSVQHKDLVLSGSVLTATTTVSPASNVTSTTDTTNAVAGLGTGSIPGSNWQAITLMNVSATFMGTFVLIMLALGAALSFGRGRTTFRLPRSADFLNT